jgi:hypothetical protein
MSKQKKMMVESSLGKHEADSSGSPVGVVRMDVEKSYAGTGELLQEFINSSSEEAWSSIKAKIDYTYENLDLALTPLESETGFAKELKSRLKRGQKLLFKPNLVNPTNIHSQTHGPDFGYTACTEWPFIAALMRWFHDKLNISYYQMSIGEAASMITSAAGQYTIINNGKTVTPEAVIEGRSDDFYGGWGFYFSRKYLSESQKPGANDDPMDGYEESVNGTYIPPGLVKDKLMVYDLNRIYDDTSKGRNCDVHGINYKSITLHKAIVGGNPDDTEDMKAYPGCILVNVPKFKVHAITIFTNVIKNLGIGLYPMQYSSTGDYKWDYSVPHRLVPGIKGGIPHEIWVPDIDYETGLPKRDKSGKYIVEKTGGIDATMIDIIKAVRKQAIFMIHIVDGIEAINIDHQGINMGEKASEGMVFAGLDPVATDLLCARYMFSNVPLEDALKVDLDDGTGGRFPQEVPIPTLEGSNIVSKNGYDCPLSRDRCFEKAEKRGLGKREYYAIGRDTVTDSPIVSLQGHLGSVKDGKFSDIITKTLFYDTFSIPWDLQKTSLSYMEAVDKLAGTSIRKEFLDTYDEDKDGIITYENFGRKGVFTVYLNIFADAISRMGTEEMGYLRASFSANARLFKAGEPQFNTDGHDVMKEFLLAFACRAAFIISQLEMDIPDPFVPGLTCGNGRWPSLQLAQFFQRGVMLYGQGFPYSIEYPSLYANVLYYADLTQNGGQYAGEIRGIPNTESVGRYMSDVSSGNKNPLDFTFYIPAGYDNLSGVAVPNVEVTDDPARILTASFAGGKEIWP